MDERLVEAFGEWVIGRWSDYAVQKDDGRYARVGHPLTLTVVQAHLTGKLTLGSYVLDERGRCGHAVFDADQQDGLATLAEVSQRLAAEDIPSVLEASRRGGHLWVFLDAWMPGWWVRQQLLPYVPRGVEFFPKQEQGWWGLWLPGAGAPGYPSGDRETLSICDLGAWGRSFRR